MIRWTRALSALGLLAALGACGDDGYAPGVCRGLGATGVNNSTCTITASGCSDKSTYVFECVDGQCQCKVNGASVQAVHTPVCDVIDPSAILNTINSNCHFGIEH